MFLNTKCVHVWTFWRPHFWHGQAPEQFIAVSVQCPSLSWYQMSKRMVQELPDK